MVVVAELRKGHIYEAPDVPLQSFDLKVQLLSFVGEWASLRWSSRSARSVMRQLTAIAILALVPEEARAFFFVVWRKLSRSNRRGCWY